MSGSERDAIMYKEIIRIHTWTIDNLGLPERGERARKVRFARSLRFSTLRCTYNDIGL
jgi:hypothetical protein